MGTTRYLVDDLNPTGYSQVVEELSGGAVQRVYTYGLKRIAELQPVSGTWTPSFYGYDGEGRVRFLTNASGAVTDTYDYDGFGIRINSTGSTPSVYLYRGEQWDSDLNLYFLRARWYNPATGRFISRDPLDIGNKYTYSDADPVNGRDPSGLLVSNYQPVLAAASTPAFKLTLVAGGTLTGGSAGLYTAVGASFICILSEAATQLYNGAGIRDLVFAPVYAAGYLCGAFQPSGDTQKRPLMDT